jgi:hypothetical protein
VAALGALGLAQPAAAKLHRYDPHVFPGTPGGRSGFIKISDDGTAVGQRLLADGTSHALILSRLQFGSDPLAGSQSALVAIDAKDEMAGSIIRPGGNTPLFLTSAGQAKTLPVVGDANGITLGPLVAVTATGADGQPHILVWNPTTNSVRDLGPGRALGIGVHSVVVGRTLAGQAAYWTADGTPHVLGFPGALIHVNLFGWVVGFASQSGGVKPIMLNLSRPTVVTPMKLPSGWPFGSAKDISDSGLIVGDAFKTPTGGLPSEGILWTRPRKPVPVQRLVRRGLPAGVKVSDASGVNDNGVIVGAITRKAAGAATVAQDMNPEEDPDEDTPDVAIDKLHDGTTKLLDQLPTDAPIGQFHSVLASLATELGGLTVPELNSSQHTSTRDAVCTKLAELNSLVSGFAFTDATFDEEALAQFKADVSGDVTDLAFEFGCVGI